MNKDLTKLLALNLQYFAEQGEEEHGEPDGTPEEQGGGTTPPEADNSEETTPPTDDKRIPYDRFKEKVDEANALKAKLAEFERQKTDAETQQLKDQEKYKELYEQAQETIATKEADALKYRKEAALVKAGYTDEQATRYLRYLEGDTDEEVSASIEVLKADIPPKQSQYVDPSAGSGGGLPPKPDATNYGRDLLNKALGKK